MTVLNFRARLLGGAALGLSSALFVSSPANAACVVSATTIVCGTTNTTNTTFPANVPRDREYTFNTGAGTITGTVTSGAVVDGYGLAFTDVGVGPNPLNVVNDGTVQIDAGNTATAGGNAALDISPNGSTSVNYSGTGSIANLSTAGSGLSIITTGTGNLTADIRGNVTNANTTGDFAVILGSLGTAGNLSVTTAAGTSIRSGSAGVGAVIFNGASTGTVTLINNATIGSFGAPNTISSGVRGFTSGLGAVSVTNNGALGSAGDRLQLGGVEARITNVASAAAVNVAGTGAIFTVGNGIEADNRGTGTNTVIYTGAINSTAGTGILANGTSGALTVTSGAITTTGGNGIQATTTTGNQVLTDGGAISASGGGIVGNSTTGNIVANANANITSGGNGITLTTGGAKTVNVASGVTVNSTGGNDIAFNGAGTGTVTNSGVIGGDSLGVAVAGPGSGAITITNNSSGTISGRVTLSGAADSFSNSGTFNTQGTSDFGAGVDVLSNNASGTINILGATAFTNLETFNQNGRLNLNNNTLTLSGTAFNNAGFIDTSGNAGILGITSFNNAGTLDLAPGTFTVPAAPFTNTGTILADEGASTITGQTSFANSGTIDLQDGVTDDVLTINSAFVGSGGSNLLVDFTAFTSDRLVINGAASGSTSINAAYLGGGLNLDGVLVVDAASATANAFVLGSVTGETPLVDVRLEQVGGDFFLVTAPTEAAFNPLVVPGFATDLWYQSADEVFAETVKPATTVGFSFWGEGYASRDRRGERNDDITIDGFDFEVNNRLKTTRYGLQGGVDYGFGGARIGLTGGYGWAKANGNAGADLKADGYNVGVYGQFGGITGFHGEFLLKHDRYNAEFDDGAFDGVDFDIRATGVDGSLGYRFGMGSANLDVLAGVSHVRTKVDDITAFGFDYDISRITSTRGRAGVRAVFGGSLSPYVSGTIYHEFSRNRSVEFFDGANFYDVDTNGRGTWGRIEAGLSGNDGPGPILAAYGDFGDRKALGFRAGFRFGGRVAEALPPPPPPPMAPPPPPPPATQTCPDGSVILATDACPPPPPPPPPAPEPERG